MIKYHNIDWTHVKLRPIEDIPEYWFVTWKENKDTIKCMIDIMNDYLRREITVNPFFDHFLGLVVFLDVRIPETMKEDMNMEDICNLKYVTMKDVKRIIEGNDCRLLQYINFESLDVIFDNSREDMEVIVSRLYEENEDCLFCDEIEEEYGKWIMGIRQGLKLVVM